MRFVGFKSINQKDIEDDAENAEMVAFVTAAGLKPGVTKRGYFSSRCWERLLHPYSPYIILV